MILRPLPLQKAIKATKIDEKDDQKTAKRRPKDDQKSTKV